MINVSNIISEFNVADLSAYVQEYGTNLGFPNLFPSQYTTSLTYNAIQERTGASVAADVVAFDSRAPRKGRELVGSLSGEIPKLEAARVKKETDINTYRQLQEAVARSNNPSALNSLIDWMYEDTTFALNAVNARAEWIAKQITSQGEFKLDVQNNAGGVVSAKITFGMPSGNFLTVGSSAQKWSSDSDDADPLADMRRVRKKARSNGDILQYAIMDQDTFDQMVKHKSVQELTAGYVAASLDTKGVPTLEQLNTALRANSLPIIKIWDSYVTLEKRDGKKGDAVTGWKEGRVAFTVSETLGEVQWTDTADSQVNIDASTKAYNDFAMVKMWAEQDPITVVTKGVAYAMPVLNNSTQHYILKTEQTS